MKATMHTHHHSKLIADVFVPADASVTNRRGHTMDPAPAQSIQQPAEHQCYEHGTSHHPVHTPRPPKPLTLAKHSVLPGILYKVKSVLPAWSPKKFTLENGVETNWEAALPTRQTLANSGLLASFLVIAAFAVWAMPQKNPPQVIAEKPTQTTGVVSDAKQDKTAPQGVLTVASSPTTPAQTSGWKLSIGRAYSASVLPSFVTSSSPSTATAATTSPSSTQGSGQSAAATPADTTTTPPSGGGTPTEPTEPTTPVVDPPVDPPAEPVEPPVIIVDPGIPGLDELLGLN